MRKSVLIHCACSWFFAVAFAATYLPLASAESTLSVELVQAERRDIASTMWVPGTVVSRNDAWISAEIEGRLIQVAEVGDVVGAGDLLARLDNHTLTLTSQDHQANIKRLQASLNFNAKQLERLGTLAESNSASRTQYDEVHAQREMVAQEMRQAQIREQQTKYDLARTEVRAPFSGRVAQRVQQAGEYAQVGSKILRLVDVTHKEIRANAPISVAPYLIDVDAVTVKVGKEHSQELLRAVVPVGDEVSRSLELRVAMSSLDALVGTAVRVAVPDSSPKSAVVVPRDAVFIRSRGSHVVRVVEEKAELVNVKTGTANGSWIEVDVITSGDSVVVRGGERLRSGQPVKILTARQPRSP